jgi:xanthine dehydrogenase YagT iron-sulfur-binding subunit
MQLIGGGCIAVSAGHEAATALAMLTTYPAARIMRDAGHRVPSQKVVIGAVQTTLPCSGTPKLMRVGMTSAALPILDDCSISGRPAGENSMPIKVNGSPVPLPTDPRTSLLDLLREQLHLSGTKIGCNQGACGACTVLVDGERIVSCLALALQYDGREVTTIEGLAEHGELHPLQAGFIEHDGFQCGYCTPGQICSAIGMAAEVRRGLPSHVTSDLSAQSITLSRDELRERMSGNLCRCGAHNGIVDAILEVYAEAAE